MGSEVFVCCDSVIDLEQWKLSSGKNVASGYCVFVSRLLEEWGPAGGRQKKTEHERTHWARKDVLLTRIEHNRRHARDTRYVTSKGIAMIAGATEKVSSNCWRYREKSHFPLVNLVATNFIPLFANMQWSIVCVCLIHWHGVHIYSSGSYGIKR